MFMQRSSENPGDQIDRAILDMLLAPEAQSVWAIEEIEREIGIPLAVYDSLRRLEAAGLIHRFKKDSFVFPTLAAVRGRSLADQ